MLTTTQQKTAEGIVNLFETSGARQRRGGITTTGNAHLRRIVAEAAWASRHRLAVGVTLRKRQAGLSEEVKAIAWRAQHWLTGRSRRLISRGTCQPQVVTAPACAA